jgi:endonuclease/exonuclease/phosphatase family metal-dependent hydrolase
VGVSAQWEEAVASWLAPSRRREVFALAQRAPYAAANIEELAIVKAGDFARTNTPWPDFARVLVWNMERGRAPDAWARIDAVQRADILLLCEVDDGMARSGNLDVAATLAERLGMHYAFAPNYFELTRGTRRERLATRGLRNLRGFHGNAILSRWPLADVRRVPLPVEFDWFRHDERRIGTRVALVATLEAPVEPLTLAVVHLETFATPAQRARQMRFLLASLREPRRAIIGGDLNTLGVRPNWRGGVRLLGQLARDANRLTRSVTDHEPLFEEARREGFSWEDLNAPSATWHWRFLPPSLRAKLDWVLARNVRVEPGSLAIVAPRLTVHAARLSDHDGVSLGVQL